MKNLVVFITPDKKFFGEYIQLTRVWIDNSLDLGWKPDDLLLVTNFDYEYNGVRAIVVGDEHYCAVRPRSIKTSVIPHLVDAGMVSEGEWYWNHDLDAFQMNQFNGVESEIGDVDLGLTDYGWRSRWCMGSYFFRKGSYDIFKEAAPIIFENVEDEEVILRLDDKIQGRHTRLNITYNFGMRKVEHNYRKSEKPVKVVHFHPTIKRSRTWDVFVLGKNGMGMPIVNERLIGVFKHHGID